MPLQQHELSNINRVNEEINILNSKIDTVMWIYNDKYLTKEQATHFISILECRIAPLSERKKFLKTGIMPKISE